MTLAQGDVSEWLGLAACVGCIALLAAAAIGDVKRYLITNRLVLGVVICFAVFAATKASWIFLGWSLAAAACILIVAAALFAFGLFGGGDTKLTAAMALWTQFADLPRFLVVMTAVGGVLGVVWMIRRRQQRARNTVKAAQTTAPSTATMQESAVPQGSNHLPNRLPYGVAIAAAGLDFFLFSVNSPLAGLLSGQ